MESIRVGLRNQSIEFMLLLDGFIHSNLPLQFLGFEALATSQSADVKSQEAQHVIKILHPCWNQDQFFLTLQM